jgi:hypothetical protein
MDIVLGPVPCAFSLRAVQIYLDLKGLKSAV